MSVKRRRDADTEAPIKTNKRPKVDTKLAQLWEQLADDDEDTRVEAAFELLSSQCKGAELDKLQTIANRLCKGVCSGRKSARLGFYTALVGALSSGKCPFGQEQFLLRSFLDIWVKQTTPEPGTSGQDERDHHFGRVLGFKAIIESGILHKADNLASEWHYMIKQLCSLMVQKPWLRAEATSVICSSITWFVNHASDNSQRATLRIYEELKKHKLARTIDGVAIYLSIQRFWRISPFRPKLKLPKDIWSSGSPLHQAELQTLKKALLDSRTAEDDDQDDLAGTSTWSPRLHPAWTVVFTRLSNPLEKDITFKDFWQEVVDQGLFHPTSTPERKLIGFLVLEAALLQLPTTLVSECFSKNLMACMIQTLKSSDEAYLSNIVHNVFGDTRSYSSRDRLPRIDAIILGLLIGSDFVDFDTVTKTKILQSLFDQTELNPQDGIIQTVDEWLRELPTGKEEPAKLPSRRKNLLNILQRAVCQSIRAQSQLEHPDYNQVVEAVCKAAELRRVSDIEGSLSIPYDESTQEVLNDKTNLMLEALLAVGQDGLVAFFEVVDSVKANELEAEEGIREAVEATWKHSDELLSFLSATHDRLADNPHASRKLAMALLLGLLLLQVYDGDEESMEMLDEVNMMAEDCTHDNDLGKVADHVIEIVLSLSSKTSRLYRRAAGMIFEAFAAEMSSTGLKSLRDVLATREGREGQQELFDNGDVDLEDASDGSASEDGMSAIEGSLGSDVEVIEADKDSNDDDSDVEASSASGSESLDDETSEVDDDHKNLNDLETALAAALGTRKFTDNDLEQPDSSSDSDSDSDMSDSQMLALDSKLSEVFRAQATQLSSQKARRQEQQNAKENVVNLKNRALDLVEIFLKQQQSRGLECAELLGALLEMARTSGTAQLSRRALEMGRGYVLKARKRMPVVMEGEEAEVVLRDVLRGVHGVVALKDVSNGWLEVAGSVNILICKSLVKAGEKDVKAVVAQLAQEQDSRDSKRKAVQDFWSRYDAWASSLQQKEKVQLQVGLANGKHPSRQEVQPVATEKAPTVATRSKKKKGKD